jgi:hypothetical protein
MKGLHLSMDFITVQEAARITGKTEMTIRRLKKKPGSRLNIYRAPDQRLYISLPFLYKHHQALAGLTPEIHTFDIQEIEKAAQEAPTANDVQPVQPVQSIHKDEQPIQKEHPELIKLLQEQVESLKHDKEYLQEQLTKERAQYHERQRESNIIIQTMQKQLPATNQSESNQEQPDATKRKPTVDLMMVVFILVLTAALVTVMLIK